MKDKHSLVVEKALILTERYIFKFGKAIIVTYQLPEVDRGKLVLFLDALHTALLRRGLLSCYLWIQSENGYYLALWVAGCYRSGVDGIVSEINHLWPLYSPYQFHQLDVIPVSATDDIDLARYFRTFAEGRIEHSAPHQRSFGASHLR